MPMNHSLSARRASALALASLILAGCSKEPSGPQGLPPELTALPRALTTAEVAVRDAANTFSFALWGKLNDAQRGENVFVSPLSASFALGMTMNGAANQTLSEMRTALQFGNASEADINAGYKSLIELLTSLDPKVQTRIANSIWYRQDFPFHQTFMDAGRTYFDAEVRGLDFANEAASLATINGWVSQKTNNKIPSILDAIEDSHVMFLINAIYFNGSWRHRFDTAETRDEMFNAADGTTQPMRLMHRLDTIAYNESDTWQAVDLPYGNSAYSMTVVLPKTGTNIESLVQSLTPATWQSLTSGFQERKVDLSLPKLKLSYERELNDELRALGMVVPFIGDVADFTRMSTSGDHLFIDFVKQKTFVDIHEEGTEAAAVTVVGIGVTSAPIIPEMRVDRPYVFVLRERLSGTVFFMGKIVKMPAA